MTFTADRILAGKDKPMPEIIRDLYPCMYRLFQRVQELWAYRENTRTYLYFLSNFIGLSWVASLSCRSADKECC